MPMMRRGPLARYNAEWVLRQASASETSGSIEFHTDQPLTLYLRNGRVCDAADGVADSVDDSEPSPADEITARARVLEFVTAAMRATDGWYYLDPIGHHAADTAWDWDAASLILDARIRRRASANRSAPAASSPQADAPVAAVAEAPARAAVEAPQARPHPEPVDAAAAALSPPADEPIGLVAPEGEAWVTLSAEAWRVTCALAAQRTPDDLLASLGWAGPRLEAALSELAAAGVLHISPDADPAPAPAPDQHPVPAPAAVAAAPQPSASEPAPAAAPAARAAVLTPAVPAAPSARPKPTADRRSALRRLISNLKPA